MFTAEVIDPALARLHELCELLVQIAPTGGYPAAPDGLLDLATGWRGFDRWCFGTDIADDAADLIRALATALHPTQQAVLELAAPVAEALCQRWAATGLPVRTRCFAT